MNARKYSGGTRHPGKRPGSRAGRKPPSGGGGSTPTGGGGGRRFLLLLMLLSLVALFAAIAGRNR